jgi:excisionase family DNA binding protein
MAFVGVQEAAGRLGVSARRIRQMVSEQKLPARRVGRAWAIDERDLKPAVRRPPHRPWKPASAWAVLAEAEGSAPQDLPAHERYRARKRLQLGVHRIIDHLAARAQRCSFYTHPAEVTRIIALPYVVRTAASAAEEHGIDIVGPGPAEAYVTRSGLEEITANCHIEGRTERPNLILRVVEDADWPFSDGTTVAPRIVAAVDLLESDDERACRAGADLLES